METRHCNASGAAVDRLISPDDDRGLGGKDAGCAVFIDRQLAHTVAVLVVI